MQKTQNAKPLQVAKFTADAMRLGGSTSANQRRFMNAAVMKSKGYGACRRHGWRLRLKHNSEESRPTVRSGYITVDRGTSAGVGLAVAPPSLASQLLQLDWGMSAGVGLAVAPLSLASQLLQLDWGMSAGVGLAVAPPWLASQLLQ
jgi:hypothetical protein